MHWVKSFIHKSIYVVNVADSLSEIEYKTVCNEEVNIILTTNESEILIQAKTIN